MSAARTFRSTQFGTPGIIPQSLGVPAAAFPGRVATNADLIVAVDRQQTSLLLPMAATDTVMTVLNPSMIGAYNLLSIDNEIVKTTGAPAGNVVPISRGFDGTVPAAHLANALVSGFIDAYHHNALVAEVEAIETALGPNLSQISGAGSPLVFSYQYNFVPQTPGGTLSTGNQVITLTPVPKGVNGSDVNHYLYISGGTGTAEAVLITGGTAVSGAASGTVIVNCANTHSGAWTIQSATAGIFEAYISLPATGGVVRVLASASPINIYGKMVFTSPKRVLILGDGADMEHNNGASPISPAGSTNLLWQGAVDGPVITFTSSSSLNLTYGGAMNLVVNCNGVATIGIQCLSTRFTILENLNILEASVADLDLNVVAGTLENNGATANACCSLGVKNLTLSNYQTTGGRSGIGIRMQGNAAGANPNYCYFTNIRIVHSSNPGIAIYSGDSNFFQHVGLAWSGTGTPAAGILLDGSAGGSVTRNNTFIDLDPGIKGLVQQNNADSTNVYGMNQINAAPVPVSTLVGNSVGGLQGTITWLSNDTVGLWSIGPAVNVAGAFSYTTITGTTPATTFSASAGGNMVNAILAFTANSPIACTTDTAAHIVAAMGNYAGNLRTAQGGAGASCEWNVINNGTSTVTITAGVGVTINGSNLVPTATCRRYKIVVTNAIPGAEAVAIFSLGAGPI